MRYTALQGRKSTHPSISLAHFRDTTHMAFLSSQFKRLKSNALPQPHLLPRKSVSSARCLLHVPTAVVVLPSPKGGRHSQEPNGGAVLPWGRWHLICLKLGSHSTNQIQQRASGNQSGTMACCRKEWVRMLHDKEICSPTRVDSADDLADMFTKILQLDAFQ